MKPSLFNWTDLLYVIAFLVSGFISWFTLTFGIGHLIEGIKQIIADSGTKYPREQNLEGWTIVIGLCVIGVVLLVIAVVLFLNILKRIKTCLRK
jgi:hypothetical protein